MPDAGCFSSQRSACADCAACINHQDKQFKVKIIELLLLRKPSSISNILLLLFS